MSRDYCTCKDKQEKHLKNVKGLLHNEGHTRQTPHKCQRITVNLKHIHDKSRE